MSWLGLLIGLFVVWLLSSVLGWHQGGTLALGALAGALIAALHRRLDRSEARWAERLNQLEAEVEALKHRRIAQAEPAAAGADHATAAPDVALAHQSAQRSELLSAAAALHDAASPVHAARGIESAPLARSNLSPADINAAARRGPDTVPMAPPALGAAAFASAATPARQRATAPAALDEASLEVTSSLGASLMAWFRNGNTIVRAGTLILFFGVAFLLRYATQHVTVPLELRVAAVALGGAALTLLGWRLRQSRRTYGLTLQGAGIGMVCITLFAAYRLYHLVPVELAFVLLAALAASTALLAVLQDALPLALFGFGGAFLAPVLASTGSGNHVALFSYYLMVNLAIAWIAQRQAWKLLNLQGFVFTFGIGTAWGLRAYTEAQFASAELFLIAHFLLYLYISLRYTSTLVRANETLATDLPTVDAGLLFGVPIAAFGLQAGMLHRQPDALAASAAVLAALYLLVGRWLWRTSGRRMLLMVEGLLALAVVFLILVTPLALDNARWTGIAWAVQGAGVLWVALRQRRGWAAGIGVALQVVAAMAFWNTYRLAADAAFFNPLLLGALVIAASFAISALLLWRASQPNTRLGWPEQAGTLYGAHWAALGLGLLQGLGALWAEVARLDLPDVGLSSRASVLFAASVLLLEAAQGLLRWPALRVCARVLLMLALLLTLEPLLNHANGIAGAWLYYVRDAGWWAVLALGMLGAWLLRRIDQRDAAGVTGPEAAALCWFAMFHSAVFVYVAAVHHVPRHEGWTPAAAIAAPTVLCLWLAARGSAGRWPMLQHRAVLQAAVLLPWLVLLALWVLAVNAFSDASMAPLPYLPLLNPLDLGHALVLLFALTVRRATGMPGSSFALGAGALTFWWLNGLLIRTLHHWADTPMWGQGVHHSEIAQSALTILWSVTACMAMWWAAKRSQRSVWLAGATLLGVVVLKLFIVDLSHIGTLARIVSFIGVGMLMLLIGYVAPLPPAAATPPLRKRAV